MDFLSSEVPLQEDLAEELIQFWHGIFNTPYESFRGILLGDEYTQNYDIIYLNQLGKRIIGTCHLTISNSLSLLGGLGEAATHPEFRRRGIASKLCKLALDTFRRRGGQALFLGTVNPLAARLYYRLGWRKLAGANVMVNISTGISPEAFLSDFFREKSSAKVVSATAAERIPMIPLLISPHDWKLLDANVGMFSTRYVVQNSCMGLYPKYEAITENGRGAWFSARTKSGRVVGLATARVDGLNSSRVDGFTHLSWMKIWKNLLKTAIDWCSVQNASLCRVSVSHGDEEKQSMFESLGFRTTRTRDKIRVGERNIASVTLQKNLKNNNARG